MGCCGVASVYVCELAALGMLMLIDFLRCCISLKLEEW